MTSFEIEQTNQKFDFQINHLNKCFQKKNNQIEKKSTYSFCVFVFYKTKTKNMINLDYLKSHLIFNNDDDENNQNENGTNPSSSSFFIDTASHTRQSTMKLLETIENFNQNNQKHQQQELSLPSLLLEVTSGSQKKNQKQTIPKNNSSSNNDLLNLSGVPQLTSVGNFDDTIHQHQNQQTEQEENNNSPSLYHKLLLEARSEYAKLKQLHDEYSQILKRFESEDETLKQQASFALANAINISSS